MTTMQTDAPLVHQQLDSTNRSARELARMVVEGQMTLDAPYQRGNVWSVRQQRDLVRSWLLGLPIPTVIVNRRWGIANFDHGDGPKAEYAVIDGKQRLTAAAAWFFGDLSVPVSWFGAEHAEQPIETDDGSYVTYAGLTLQMQRWSSNRALMPMAEALVPTISDEAAIFGLVNGGGVEQTSSDMARAARIAAQKGA